MAIVMLNYARSGGTLLNKCLASLSNIVMLSEINPLGGGWSQAGAESYSTVYEQAFYWYGIQLKSKGFKEAIEELEEYCASHNKILIIRDWSYINFAHCHYNAFDPPNRFLILETLSKQNLKIFGFIRNPIDIWISQNCPEINQFTQEYFQYLKTLNNLKVPVFKYEEFATDPKKQLEKICKTINISYQDVFDKCLEYSKVNGDTQRKSYQQKTEISLNPRKTISLAGIKKLHKHKLMGQICQFHNYESSYFSEISYLSYIKKYPSFVLKRLLKTGFIQLKKIRKMSFFHSYQRWIKDKGDQTHRLNYQLNENSIVFDLGAYIGHWTNTIFYKYQCNIYSFEPVSKFFKKLKIRFNDNDKIKLFQFGLSAQTGTDCISIDNNKSSTFKIGKEEQIKMIKALDFLNQYNIAFIDLMKINIEGGEYELLQHLIESGCINKIRNIQVQFHDFVPQSKKRMKEVQQKLSKTHRLTYQYLFIWENWQLK
ncbi:MAG: FkbM family methyltransferase [Spirochaetes bacterium]|nr:FkbM family methyltransferase [Spirochaetota bacterium]